MLPSMLLRCRGAALSRSAVPRLAATPLLSRALSTRPTMTLEQALTSTHLMIAELESPAAVQQLQSLQSGGDMMAKWQMANAVLIHATMRVLPQCGYTADGPGLQGYMQAFAECMNSGSEEVKATLRGLNESKWTVLLKHAFGCAPAPPLELAKARAIAIDMVDALQDAALVKQVEESRQGLSARLPESERQMLVARAIVAVQAEVVSRYGFEGDAGYAQAQVALMEHASDAVVTASIAAATSNLYARGGIDLQQALQTAAGM